ncbi:hypothetical protein C7H85_11800 [Zobellella endophytica]|uniref:Transmembrane cytochrome oxidase associated protein n=1 Tax=Zobellella endophytica TaxID=2116700 RepID=A0A2P7R537_9GAMM|nr:hypothetical protein [Zobellella endophytica]PSJ45329.1 hypothetical protein C7H85_11800 [Zobellella endophytica]
MKHKPVLALLGVFLLPVALAWLTLQQGWFTPGVKARGEWVEGHIAGDEQWRLVLPVVPECASCAVAGQLLENIDTALGRDSERVTVVRLPASAELEAGFVYIADPPGLLIMRYPLSGDEQRDRLTGKALLGDLRRLLKFSRAG